MIGFGNSMFLATHGILAKSASGAAVDPDAQAFITAASITDPTQQSAINQLVVDLKGYGIWTKLRACYPFIGGTSSTHKWNLKDPRDLDVAFRLVFNGGWTHSANGATPNGTNAYADTKLTPSTHLTLNNAAIGYYSRTNSNNLGVEIGARMASPNSDVSLGIYGTTPLAGRINTFADSAQLITTDTLGFYQVTRNGGSTQKVFKGTSSNSGSITTSTAAVNLPIFIGAMNQAVLQFYSNRQCAFSYISDGLTDTQAANFYTAVQAYQTTLGRQV